ncbi:MAG: replication initiator protein A [Bacillota bacterium]
MVHLELFKKEDLQLYYAFLQMPRVMIEKEIAQFKLSINEKFLYILLLDRISLSAKNNWVNDEGNVFVFYKLEEIAKQMECSKTTAKKTLDGLVSKNFVVKESRGIGKANRIYVGNVCPLCSTPYESVQKKEVQSVVHEVVPSHGDCEAKQVQKTIGIDNELLGQVIATVTREVIKAMGIHAEVKAESTANVETEVTQEQAKVKVHTDSISNEKVSYINQEEVAVTVQQEILEAQGIPQKYMHDKQLMGVAVKRLVSYDEVVAFNENIFADGTDPIHRQYLETFSLFCDALTDMLTNRNVANYGGAMVSAENVHTQLAKYTFYAENIESYAIDDLSEAVQSSFNKAMGNTIIKNKMKYMQTCIWNRMLTLQDEMEQAMATLEREIRVPKRVSQTVAPVSELQEDKLTLEQFFEAFTTRWRAVAEVERLTSENKSLLKTIYHQFPSDIILRTLDKVLEQHLLESMQIHNFVGNFRKLVQYVA